MTSKTPLSDEVIKLSSDLLDIQADYIARLVELFTLIDKNVPMREFEMSSRGLTDEDINLLRAIPPSCLRNLPIAFELDTSPLRKLNKFIEQNGLSYDALPDEVSVIVESLQAERTKSLGKNKRL